MAQIFSQLAWLALYDLAFIGLLLLLLVPLKLYRQAAYAVLWRNFIAYFANPTGYVFLCFFVLLTSVFAFWPNEFFVRNLANLDQLNLWLPFIMLVFIPAITMSIWADERRQGTDELLLTLPAADFDIVIGKYLAAAAVFTVSLLFSQYFGTFMVLISLAQGDVDTGLFFTTYLGYWFIGLAMLSIGMVASFLTNNLTVGFILGGLFNAPLVFLVYADTILPANLRPHWFSRWSFSQRFDDFGRGVISFSGVTYFLLIVVLGIYLSMVLIGRRHWLGGRDGQSMLGHYVVRALALVGLLVGANVVLSNHDLRADMTAGRVGSLSPDTRTILSKLENKSPVKIEAFLSARVPDEYVKTKYNLVSMLKELQSYSGSKVTVVLHDNLEEFSKEVTLAEDRFGIRPQQVPVEERGERRTQNVILGAAFTCGVEKIIVPFFGNGIPVEYELVRAISTVSQPKRKKLGLVQTDVNLKGGFSFAGGQPRQIQKQQILDDIERQYRVEDVDTNSPIQVLGDDGTLRYDVLLVVQPSSLAPTQLQNLVAAIKQGQPTVIFEDPLPYVFDVVGTSEDKPAPGGMFGMGGAPQPKGDTFKILWEALGIAPIGEARLPGTLPGRVVCQAGNPYRRFGDMPSFGPFIFLRQENAGTFSASQDAVKNFEELLIPFSGGITQESDDSELTFTELVNTAKDGTSTLDVEDMRLFMRSGSSDTVMQNIKRTPERAYTIAAWIRGKETEEQGAAADKSKAKDDGKEDKGSKEKKGAAGKDGMDPDGILAVKKRPINAIYVADIDLLGNEWLQMRNAQGPDQFRWDNGPFVLNMIDAVAGDERYLAIRQRKPRYSTLQRIEDEARRAGAREDVKAEEFQKSFNEEKSKLEENVKKIERELTDLREAYERLQNEGKQVDVGEAEAKTQVIVLKLAKVQSDADTALRELSRNRDKGLEEIRRERDQAVRSVQNEYKLWSVAIPPIPPLLVGFIVFVRRRLREREGMPKNRIK